MVVLCFLFLASYPVFSQDIEFFRSDVETVKKPWTNLDFYNDPDNFQFALVSDNTGGSRLGIFEQGVEKLNMMMPEFVLCVGDLIQGYTEDTSLIRSEWNDFNKKIDKLSVPFFYLPGNHDITNLVMQKEWEERYGRRYYHFVYKNVLFVIMDSNDDDDHNLTEEQTEYAIHAINENPDVRWTFVLMHHPIWKYDTDDRFEKIEDALSTRKHTVIAGHEHHYKYTERKDANYYVLGTTGAGTALRGNRFGEFDHIVWVTMADNGPIMANLRLDGILAHDISNEVTEKMARVMLDNTSLKQLVLTNPGEKFTNGTAYLHFKNNSDVALIAELSFFHHHQVDILPSKQKIRIQPGEEKTMEIALKSHEPTGYKDMGFVQYYWKISYDGLEYRDFSLDGNADFPIEPSTPDYFYPFTPQFVDEAKITFGQPFNQLKSSLKINGSAESTSFPSELAISTSSKLEVILANDKNEQTKSAARLYEKIDYLKGKKISKLNPGLSYAYYEGNWSGIPDFTKLTPKKTGVTIDFSVGDLAVSKNNFGVRYTGFIEITEDGMYYFRCLADDAGSLKIHNKLICLDGASEVFDNSEHRVNNFGAIALKKGMHPVEIDFMENIGNERLRMYYKKTEASDWIFMELEDFFRTSNRK